MWGVTRLRKGPLRKSAALLLGPLRLTCGVCGAAGISCQAGVVTTATAIDYFLPSPTTWDRRDQLGSAAGRFP